jgi:hypothetical protein
MAKRLPARHFWAAALIPGAGGRRFIASAGTLVVVVLLVCTLAPSSVQIATVGIIVSVILAMLLARDERERVLAAEADLQHLALLIAKDDEALDQLRILTRSLASIVEHNDPLFRSLALERTATMAGKAEELAGGTIVFEDTETWRIAYERLLQSPGLHLYRSVAMVHSPAYWQDEPGRQSMRLNFELQDSGTLSIERTIVIADELWPSNEHFPTKTLQRWIDEQHNRGIWLRLVRLSSLINEPELHTDFGIYGTRAVGVQEHALPSRTVRFVLMFDFDRVREAEARWDRLAVYATSYRDLLDSPEFEL